MNVLLLLTTAFIIHQVNGYGRKYRNIFEVMWVMHLFHHDLPSDTTPNGVNYMEVNSTITIACTIDLNDPQSEGLNSSYLSFKLVSNGEEYEPTEGAKVIENKI